MFRRSVGDTSKQPYFHLSACRRSSGAGIQSAIQGEWVFTRRIEDCAKPPAPGVSQAAPQLQQLVDDDAWRRYRDGLQRLRPRDRRLVVGRAELGYSYQQLALIERLPSTDAARMALRRALIRLSDVMSDP